MPTGEEFLDTDLSRALDRDSTYYGGGIQVELTPLTTFLTDVEIGEDRFVGSSERDADTWKVMPGFKFKPFALVDGGLAVGYRKFQTLNSLVPDFGGVIALVDLGYTLRATRVTGRYNRDVTYSFETVEPYYLQTDWSVAVVQKITTAWDVVGRVGRYKLDYETVGLPGTERRSDSGNRYGGGIGYSLGQYVRAWLRNELHRPAVRRVRHEELRGCSRGPLWSLTEPSNDETALSRRHRSDPAVDCRRGANRLHDRQSGRAHHHRL